MNRLLLSARPLASSCARGLASAAQRGRPRTVKDVMTKSVALSNPEDTVQSVAQMMDKEDTGAVPIADNDKLIGMVTDRDIAIRLAATGKDPARTKVREVMSKGTPMYCFEDEDISHIADVMAEQQVRRLPVMSREKRLVGIISLSNISQGAPPEVAAKAVKGVTSGGKYGGMHNPTSQEGARYDRGAQPM